MDAEEVKEQLKSDPEKMAAAGLVMAEKMVLALVKTMDSMEKSLERIAEAQERTATLLEEIAVALEQGEEEPDEEEPDA